MLRRRLTTRGFEHDTHLFIYTRNQKVTTMILFVLTKTNSCVHVTSFNAHLGNGITC